MADDGEQTLIIGTGIAGLQTMYDNCVVIANKEPMKVSPFWIPVTIANMASRLENWSENRQRDRTFTLFYSRKQAAGAYGQATCAKVASARPF